MTVSVAPRGARVFPIPPPAYYGAAFNIGAAALLSGLALDLVGVVSVAAHHTTIVPHRPVKTLITGGIYRASRNPMYTGLAIMVAGAAVLVGTRWP